MSTKTNLAPTQQKITFTIISVWGIERLAGHSSHCFILFIEQIHFERKHSNDGKIHEEQHTVPEG